MLSRLLMTGTGLVVMLAVVTAAGWWFLVRQDAQLATSAPEIPEELVQAAASPAPDATQGSSDAEAADPLTFRIDPGLSEAAYFVDEELASVGLPSTAKGSTTEIEGEFYLTADGTALATTQASQFAIDLRNLTSDKAMRDQRVQEALETSQYPQATFSISSVSGYDPSIPAGEEQSLQLTGILDLHGVQKEVTWDVKAVREANVISALATLTVAFADFDITPPTFAQLVSIDDEATLQIQLIAAAA